MQTLQPAGAADERTTAAAVEDLRYSCLKTAAVVDYGYVVTVVGRGERRHKERHLVVENYSGSSLCGYRDEKDVKRAYKRLRAL